jgi:serine/threonine protein kinase
LLSNATCTATFWAQSEPAIFQAVTRGKYDITSEPWNKISAGAKAGRAVQSCEFSLPIALESAWFQPLKP